MSTDALPTARGSLSSRVGMEIQVALLRAGMSGRELGRRLGRSQTWVSTRLNGTTPLDVNDLQDIADAIGVPVIRLLPDGSRTASSDLSPGINVRKSHMAVQPIRAEPIIRSRRHVAAGPSPFSPQRRDSARPVSAVPANRRRPTLSGPLKQPIPA